MAPDWIQGLSVPAFLKGLKDKVSGQEAMQFGKPQTITDAVEQVMHLQCTARTFGGHRSMTNRHVVFEDDVPEATPQNTNIDRVVDSVVRQLKQVGWSPNETPRRDTCFTCGGAGHRSRDCATKRRRSPSPLTCYECVCLGHLSRECANTLERRRGSVKPSRRHRRRRRSTSSSDSVSSSSQEDTHQHHRGGRDNPRRKGERSTPQGSRDLAHGMHRSQNTHEGGNSRSPSPRRDYSAWHNRSPSPRRDLSASPTRKVDGRQRP